MSQLEDNDFSHLTPPIYQMSSNNNFFDHSHQQLDSQEYTSSSAAIYLPDDLNLKDGEEFGIPYVERGKNLDKFVAKLNVADNIKTTLLNEKRIYAHIEPQVPLLAGGLNIKEQFKSYRTSLTLGGESLIHATTSGFFSSQTIGFLSVPSFRPKTSEQRWPYRELAMRSEFTRKQYMGKYLTSDGLVEYDALLIGWKSSEDTNESGTLKITEENIQKAALDPKEAKKLGYEIFLPFLVKKQLDSFWSRMEVLIAQRGSQITNTNNTVKGVASEHFSQSLSKWRF